MKIKFICECGADMFLKSDFGADEATVACVVSWIRSHSLHGVRRINRKESNQQIQPMPKETGKAD